ncbi:TRAP transporter large permease [Psychromarinibacter halotolerans]|uniref:TRAP transporter large permease protein n=1 Tax=Psychromarinibacter halotolerans TaxID=1775175 RepID=A0ABV7GSM0_9RHOB
MDISVGFWLIAILLFGIMIGLPVALALITSSLIGIAAMRSPELAGRFLAAAANDSVNDYLFGVIPLFVLMGMIVSASGMGRDTFDVFESLLRRLSGGLGVATVAANTVFAAITGVSIASAAVFSKIAVPEMRRHGYSAELAVGTVAGSSVLGMLIPPSLLLIVYGIIAEESIGRLFLAGLLPGALLALIFAAIILITARLRPGSVGQRADGAPLPENAALPPRMSGPTLLAKIAPMLILILLVLGGIYSGKFSPTEAGAVGVAGALVIALLRRSLGPRSLWRLSMETGSINVSILFLIIAATLYSRALSLSGLPASVADGITALNLGYVGFLICYVAILLVLGCFIDSVSILLIVIPIMLPVIEGMGLDPIWFGIVSIVSIEVGLLTPPFGLSAFVVKSSLNDPDLTLGTIFRGAFPFLLGMLLLVAILAVFPQIALVLAR